VEQTANEIRVGYADPDINALLAGIGGERRPFGRHFSHNEDFFLELGDSYEVEPLPIHHDVHQPVPSASYRRIIRGVIRQVAALAPQVLAGLTYFFDPAENLRPCFYQVFSVDGVAYLYLVRADLTLRPGDSQVSVRGTNSETPRYSTRRFFLEATVIPLDSVVGPAAAPESFTIRQTISQTWIGEFGRGYFQQGIWMDADLTKFFSKLFLPRGMRVYPYYPFLCKYKTVCGTVIGLEPERRAAMVPQLHRSLGFLLPVLETIQSEMRSVEFSESLPVFQSLKASVPDGWYQDFANVKVAAYLNASAMKEFRIED
jgi:hypothetical protein